MTEGLRTRSAVASRLACADSSFPKLSHDVALLVIRDLGIPAVDICSFAGYDHNPPAAVVDDPRGAADVVLRRLDGAELIVADVFAILSAPYDLLAVNHPDADVRRDALRQLERMLEFTSFLDAPGLTVLPGTTFAGVEAGQSRELAAKELQRFAELAGDEGMTLSVEPHYGSIISTPRATLELLAQAPDLLLTLDLGHFVFQGITQADVDPLYGRTRHLHVRQAAPGVMQAPVSEGVIDFDLVLERLAGVNYAGYLGLEYQWDAWMDFNRVDCISETCLMREALLGKR